jgi:hypothetical protein
VPIPGTTKRHRLEENLGAAAIQLTADDLRDIDREASQIAVHGARYPEHLQKMVGRRDRNAFATHLKGRNARRSGACAPGFQLHITKPSGNTWRDGDLHVSQQRRF